MFVLDASIVASWCFPDEAHPFADAAFERIASDTAIAPSLLWFELRNVLLMGERRKRLTQTQTSGFLQQIGDLPIETDIESESDVILNLARTYQLTVYDAAYLELAQRKSLPLATLDSALMDAARAVHVLLVGEET